MISRSLGTIKESENYYSELKPFSGQCDSKPVNLVGVGGRKRTLTLILPARVQLWIPAFSQLTLSSVCVCAKLLHLCLTLCDSGDCSQSGSSVHGILQARILEWGCLLPGDLPKPGIEPASLLSPALAGGSLPLAPTGKPLSLELKGETLFKNKPVYTSYQKK